MTNEVNRRQCAVLAALVNRPDGIPFGQLRLELRVPDSDIFRNDSDYRETISALVASQLCRIDKSRVHLTSMGIEAGLLARNNL